MLEVALGSPLTGSFEMGQGRKWRSEVVVKNTKVYIDIGFANRTFTLERDGDKLILKTTYPGTFNGFPNDNTVELRKR